MSEVPLPTRAYDIVLDPEGADGHAYGRPPGIAPVQWPRSRVNGLPMAHLFTLRIPEEYRGAGPDFVAVSLFQADDHVATGVRGVSEVIDGGDPPAGSETGAAFWAAVRDYAGNRHPMERYMEDLIDGGWALIWLTGAEFAGPASPLPDAEAQLPGYSTMDGTDAYRADRPAQPLRLTVRDNDPNVGRPIGNTEAGYVDPYSPEGKALGLAELPDCHIGGTNAYYNGGAPDISPWYVEFDESLGEVNVGGGTALVDLVRPTMEWSCG